MGTNQTPTGIDDALATALATSFQLQRSAVDVISVKAAVAAMFRPENARRLEVEALWSSSSLSRRTAVRSSLEPALETEFQLLLPEGSGMTVDQALAAVNSVKEDPEPLIPLLTEVIENYGLATGENVSLRFTSPSSQRVESVFVASRWGPCGGDAVCNDLEIPLRYREVWCAKVPDLATVRPDGFCGLNKPSSSQPCPDHLTRPPTCGWQISSWSSCRSATAVCHGEGMQEREVVCLSNSAEGCSGPEPARRRECQCLITVTGEGQGPDADSGSSSDETSILVILPAVLGSLAGACCCCICLLLCLTKRGQKKVAVQDPKERSENTEEPLTPESPSSRPAVGELLAECERRQISTKGCLERADLEELLQEPEPPSLRKAATAPPLDRPSSPMSPSRVGHFPSPEDHSPSHTRNEPEPVLTCARPSPSGTSDVSTRQSGSPISSKSSTGRYDGSVATPSSQELHQKIPAPPVAAAVPGAVPAAAPPVAPGPASPERKPKASPSRSSSAKRDSKDKPKPPPLSELADQTNPEATGSPLRSSTATWTSSPSRSPTRSRTTLGGLATSSRPASRPSGAAGRSLQRSQTSPGGALRPTTAPSSAPSSSGRH